MRFPKVLFSCLAITICLMAAPSALVVAAAPGTSPYAKIPKKKGKLEASDGVQALSEDTVRPEEVFKHGVQEISVIATDTGFHPSKVYVRKNIPVHLFLTSASPAKLCFIMDDFQIRKGVSIQP